MNAIKRGDVYYIKKTLDVAGSEQLAGRPAVIVSNNIGNEHSDTLEVVPTHVTITSTPKESTALCEQVTTIAKERVGRLITQLSEAEMRKVDAALRVSLDIDLENTVYDCCAVHEETESIRWVPEVAIDEYGRRVTYGQAIAFVESRWWHAKRLRRQKR